MLNTDQIKARLKAAIVKAGGATKFAAKNDMTEGYVHRVMRTGKPGKRLSAALKVREIRGVWEEVK